MSEISIEQRLAYWQNKIGTGSRWLLQTFNTAYLTVSRVYFDKSSKAIVVEYSMDETSNLIHTSEVGYFLNFIAHSRVQ